MPQRAYLVLQDGTVFEGYSFGASGEVSGEVVFTTGMTGYLETLADSSYYGQIIAHTFPMIGNYGVISEDFDGETPAAKGYIVKQWCQDPSNFRSEGDLDAFLKRSGVVGLYGIDTRRLTKLLREKGVMNGKITMEKPNGVPDDVKSYKIQNAVASRSAKSAYIENQNGIFNVAVLDFGLRRSVLNGLISRGCAITVYPHNTTAQTIIANGHDGVLLTSGAGDPRDDENAALVAEIKKLIDAKIPLFGISFGGNLLALANGFKLEKLKYGHRGSNLPARDLTGTKTYITGQNHGYTVARESIDESIAEEWFRNINDGTNEGLLFKNSPASCVMFYPDANNGPQDTSWLFDRFVVQMEVYNAAR